jgi:L-2,4-diaminobutyric acid acetyltransferase
MLGMTKGGDRGAAAAIVPDYWLRTPNRDDGPAVTGLVEECPPLDRNSRYCNLLQCTDFADTCVLAETNSKPIGWVSAYRPPFDDASLFVWQVAVHPEARGIGLGKEMILDILRRPVCSEVDCLKTTVTPDNFASRAMFRSLAESLNAPIEEQLHFDHKKHFEREQNSEHLITIGSFSIAAI